MSPRLNLRLSLDAVNFVKPRWGERTREPGGRKAANCEGWVYLKDETVFLAFLRGSLWVSEHGEAARGYALPTGVHASLVVGGG